MSASRPPSLGFPLPCELVLEIVKYIPAGCALAAFTRTCRQTYQAACDALCRAACGARGFRCRFRENGRLCSHCVCQSSLRKHLARANETVALARPRHGPAVRKSPCHPNSGVLKARSRALCQLLVDAHTEAPALLLDPTDVAANSVLQVVVVPPAPRAAVSRRHAPATCWEAVASNRMDKVALLLDRGVAIEHLGCLVVHPALSTCSSCGVPVDLYASGDGRCCLGER